MKASSKCACGSESIAIKDGYPVCAICKANEDAQKFGLCLCSRPAFRRKSNAAVYRRCFTLEKERDARAQLTRGGAKPFPNPYAYALCGGIQTYADPFPDQT